MSLSLNAATEGLVKLDQINILIQNAENDIMRRVNKIEFRVLQVIIARQICEYEVDSHGVRLSNVFNILSKEMSS